MKKTTKRTTKKTTSTEEEVNPFAGHQIVYIKLDDIEKTDEIPNMRDIDPKHVDALATSIKENGLESPLLIWNADRANVRKGGVEKPAAFLTAGFHRHAALKKLPASFIKKEFPEGVPCYVIDGPLEKALMAQFRENAMRKELGNKETIEAVARLSEEFELSNREIAKAIGKTEAHVSVILSLYNTLDESEWADLCDGYLSFSDAKDISKAVKAAQLAAETGEGEEEAEEEVKATKTKAAKKTTAKKAKGGKAAAKRIGNAVLIARYKTLPSMSAVKKLPFAEAVIAYINNDTDSLPSELIPAEKPKATKKTGAKKTVKKAAKKTVKKAAKK